MYTDKIKSFVKITETIFRLNSLDEDDKEKLILYLTRKSLPKA